MTRIADRLPESMVWVAFSGRADLPWLRLLRPGFRHCFAAVEDNTGWTVIDPLSRRLVVQRLAVDVGFDLPTFWRRAGFRVLGPFVPLAPSAGVLPPLAPFNCVTACLRLLGLNWPLVLTPFGLYRRLSRHHATAEIGKKS
ncbi:hypothetical protein [Elioraea sp.]|uniref:hypothetical protein n=1 Tax=Elioraea sp. TaxID=2185103 RepID=UPI003F725BEC